MKFYKIWLEITEKPKIFFTPPSVEIRLSSPQMSTKFHNLLDVFPCYCHPNYCQYFDAKFENSKIFPHRDFCYSQILLDQSRKLDRNGFTFSFENFIPEFIKNGLQNSSSLQNLEMQANFWPSPHPFQDTLLLSTYFYNQTFQNYADQIYLNFCSNLAKNIQNLAFLDNESQKPSNFLDRVIFNPKILSCFDHFICQKLLPEEFSNQKILNGRCPVFLEPKFLICFYPAKSGQKSRASSCPLITFDFDHKLANLNTSNQLTKVPKPQILRPDFYFYKPKIFPVEGHQCQVQQDKFILKIETLDLSRNYEFACNRSQIADAVEFWKEDQTAKDRYLFLIGKIISSISLRAQFLDFFTPKIFENYVF